VTLLTKVADINVYIAVFSQFD